MQKFAHMSDLHIGAFRQPELRALVLRAFEAAIDRCISEKVSFVLMSGDIFDSNIPDLASVTTAAAKMKQASDAGIRFYAIYGSHDFSPNYSSMVDVLDGAGLFRKAEVMTEGADEVKLRFIQDPSGPKLCGISGRKLSIDREEFSRLDATSLEAEQGFKIFMFHGAIEELKPPSLEKMQGMPASDLPAGFNYYAGGHVHNRGVGSLPGRPNIAYPGPLFATDYLELLQLAKGEERGFYLCDFDELRVRKVAFVPVKVCDVVELHYSAHGKTSSQAMAALMDLASTSQVEGKVVLLTVEGELSEGKTSDIDFVSIRKKLLDQKPLTVLTANSHLTSRETAVARAPPKAVHATEREIFERQVARVQTEEPKLRGEQGVALAIGLLRTLKEGKHENENRGEFEERTSRAGFDVLGIEEEP